MLSPRRIGRIFLVIAAVLSIPLPAAAQQWFGTPADVFWVPLPNRPDLRPHVQPRDPLVRCRTALRFAGQFHTPIAEVLEACPMLARAIEWEDAPGSLQPYDEWDVALKERLEDLFQRLLDHRSSLGLSCPDSLAAIPALNVAYLTEDQAFGIYAAHVAHAIYLEATRRVPWSIVSVPHEELRILLASPSYFVRVFGKAPFLPPHIDPARAFTLPPRVLLADGLVCDPRVGYRFLSGETSTGGENLIGATEEETLARIGVWMARDVGHGAAADRTLEHQQQYSYLQDRLKARPYWPYTIAIMSAGCHSAASFIHDLAKSVNIPLLAVLAHEEPPELWPPGRALNHQGLLFHWTRKDMRVLWHADDYYLAYSLAPYFPIDRSGRALAPAAAVRLFFDVNFVAPEVLTAHDFAWYPGPSTFGEPSPGPSFFSVPVIGTWPRAVPRRGYDWDLRYDLCSWIHFVQRGGLLAAYDVMTSFTTYGPWPLSHPMESFGPRADACAAAYGGLDAVRGLAAAHEAARGSNLYATPPIYSLPPGLASRLPR